MRAKVSQIKLSILAILPRIYLSSYLLTYLLTWIPPLPDHDTQTHARCVRSYRSL